MEIDLATIRPHIADYEITSFQQENDSDKYELVIQSQNRIWSLRMELGSAFPFQLPSIYLKDKLSVIKQHICWKQQICITDGVAVSTNFNQPELVVAQSLNEAVKIIDQPLDSKEFWDEFEGYWLAYSERPVELFVDPGHYTAGSGVYELGAYKTTKGVLLGFYDSFTKLAHKSFGYKPYGEQTEHRSYLICLTSLSNPPLPKTSWTTSKILSTVKKGLTKPDLRKLERKLSKGKSKYRTDIVFRVNRPSGGYNVFACNIEFINGKGLFGELSLEDKVLPLYCDRFGTDFLLERGGGITSLSDKTVAVIGCGSLGGYIANMIAQSGIKELNLVDPDLFNPENLYRHVLPSYKLKGPKTKVGAMRELLISEFPHIHVNSHPMSYQDWFKKKGIEDIDCIVFATGDPSLERKICAELYGLEDSIDVVHCWQEGMGLGGHVVGYNTASNGCLNCLYMKSGSPKLSPSTSFIDEGQIISKTMGGCVAAFTPFSAVDANQTASIASRMVINALTNSTPCAYEGWKSGAPLPEANVIRKTNFYDSYGDLKDNVATILSSSTCNVCKHMASQ